MPKNWRKEKELAVTDVEDELLPGAPANAEPKACFFMTTRARDGADKGGRAFGFCKTRRLTENSNNWMRGKEISSTQSGCSWRYKRPATKENLKRLILVAPDCSELRCFGWAAQRNYNVIMSQNKSLQSEPVNQKHSQETWMKTCQGEMHNSLFEAT